MSSNVVDLFDKAALIQQRSAKQLRKVQEFITSIDVPDRPLGDMFAKAIRYSLGVKPQFFQNGMTYGYQIRSAANDREKAKVYLTGRSVMQRTLVGRQERPWELFQVRYERRMEPVEQRPWTNNICIARRYTNWLTNRGIRFVPSISAVFWLIGNMMTETENFWIESIKDDSAIFEVHLASATCLARVRIYADALLSDITALVDAGVLTSMELT